MFLSKLFHRFTELLDALPQPLHSHRDAALITQQINHGSLIGSGGGHLATDPIDQ